MHRTAWALILFALPSLASAADWPMGGRDGTRNSVSPEKGALTDWQVKTDEHAERNIRWSVALGSYAIGGPVVSGGMVWVGTNNERPLDPDVKGDRSVLACFRESDGKFLFQYTSTRRDNPHDFGDWPGQSLSGSPYIEGDRLWFRSNRAEVICLDIGPLRKGTGLPKVIWKLDLISDHGVRSTGWMIPGHDTHGSIAAYKDFIYLHTGNGMGPDGRTVPAPDAPSLVCLRKDNGKLVWKDASPGKNLRYGQYSSPLVVEIAGVAQVILPQGDGWVRAFDALTGKFLWRFDLNAYPDQPERNLSAYGVATPVYAHGRVYVSLGRHPEGCGGDGRLCCLDPTKRGDITSHVRGRDGKYQPNANTGLVWQYIKAAAKDAKVFQLTLASVAVSEGLVIAVDHNGIVHCLDETSGKLNWTDDTKDAVFGPPLVVDGKIYAGNQDGTVIVWALSKEKKRLAKREVERSIVAGLVFANGTLYVLTEQRLYAIGSAK